MSTKPGISDYELKHEKVMAHFDSVFSHRSSTSRDHARAALHTALGVGLDRDTNMSSHQKHGVIQRDEFHQIVDGLHAGKVISEDEAKKLKLIAEKPLRD